MTRSKVRVLITVCSVLAVAGLLLAQPALADGARDEASAASLNNFVPPQPGAPILEAGPGSLYNNGPILSNLTGGVGGASESILQTTSLGMNILGFGHQVANDNRVSDDFCVPEGHTWTVSQISLYAYQTGSDTTSTMTGAFTEITTGGPDGTVVELEADRFSSTGWSGIYRVTEETTGIASDRPIMTNVTNGYTVPLTTGQHWLNWETDGTLLSGPWAPPITVTGAPATGDALQSIAGAPFVALVDSGNNLPQGLPFIIDGSTTGPTMTATGTCPGVVTITISGGSPGGSAAILTAANQGCIQIGAPTCNGATIGLNAPSVLSVVPLDASGSFTTSPNVPAAACGLYIEAVDTGTCSATTVAQIPQDLP